MDAVEFIKERYRICKSYICNDQCPLGRSNLPIPDLGCGEFIQKFPAEAVSIVEKWSNEHPPMTNAMKFEEIFGEKPTNKKGEWICPPIAFRKQNACSSYCSECYQWWEKPYKEPEKKNNE